MTERKGRRCNWRQACEILCCKKDYFYGLVKSGKLPAYKLQGRGRGLWVYEADCRRLVQRISALEKASGPDSDAAAHEAALDKI